MTQDRSTGVPRTDPPGAVASTLGLIVIVVLALALCVGGWYGYWALKKANTNKQYEVNTHTQQYQAGLVATERDAVVGWQNANDPGQKNIIKTTFCSMYANLTQPPADLMFANTKICG